jgi:signal transduction histidine kinase
MNRNFIPADQFFVDLQDTIHAALEHAGIRYHFTKDISGRPEFTSAMCRDIKLIFFELLNNVLKHSVAADVHVNLKADEQTCLIDFYDNGVLTETGNLKKSGFGLNNIEKRVARYGGTVQWTIAPGGKGLYVEMNFKNSGIL